MPALHPVMASRVSSFNVQHGARQVPLRSGRQAGVTWFWTMMCARGAELLEAPWLTQRLLCTASPQVHCLQVPAAKQEVVHHG